MRTQKDLAAQLNATAAHITKIGTETRTLLDKIDELKTAIENQDDVSPELQAAADAVDAQVAIVDALVPDPTIPAPDTGDTGAAVPATAPASSTP